MLIIHGLSGLYFEQTARLRFDTGYRAETFAILIQTDKAIYKPGQTGINICMDTKHSSISIGEPT